MPTYKNRQCDFCTQQIGDIDYKNVPLITKYLSQYKKIVPRYYKGTCIKHQKKLSKAIKNARQMAMITYTSV